MYVIVIFGQVLFCILNLFIFCCSIFLFKYFIGQQQMDSLVELPPIKSQKTLNQENDLKNVMSSRFGQVPPLYVKHAYPQLFQEKQNYHNFLPKIPQLSAADVEERYGLMYNTPTTEAEIKMHDLWVAKRKEEV